MEFYDFPPLEESLENYSLKQGFIAAYPNYLALGYLLINNSDTGILANSYIKIPIYCYQDFYNALSNIGKFLIHEKKPETNSTTIFETDTYQLNWCIEDNIVFLKINNHPTNKTSIEIDLVQYYYLITGYKELFFKPFCLKYFIIYSFYRVSELKTKPEIEAIISIVDAVQTTDNLQLNFKKEELFLVSENIIRYKTELLLYINLKTVIPPRPF